MRREIMAAGTLAEARGVTVRLGDSLVLDDVDLSVRRGEIVTLVGPNGSGKTTLVRVVLGLLRPDAGAVRLGQGVRIGYVPQHLHVDATLPLTARRFLSLGGRVAEARLAGVLAEVGAAHVLDSPFQTLSGGESKRVMLARALLRDPDLLVLDEPTAGVDVSGQGDLYDLVTEIRDRRNCGVLLVSHNLHLVMAATDHVICLNRHVCCRGRPETVSRQPEYLALFGPEAGGRLAVYPHRHDHGHALSGEPVGPADDRHRHD